MSEKKRRRGKKSAAVVAFAATLLASNAASVLSAAEETPGDLNNLNLSDVDYTGASPDFKEIYDNVYVASNSVSSVKGFYGALNNVKNFGLYAKSCSSNHLECNAAVESINEFNLQYGNIVRLGTIGSGTYIVYLGAAPTATTRLDMANIPADAKVEVVLNFGFEREDTDNGNRAGFNANGVHYELLNVKTSNLTIRNPGEDEAQFNIQNTLDQIANTGSSLLTVAGTVSETSGFNATLENAYKAIQNGVVGEGETLVINADAADIERNSNFEENIKKILLENGGVNVVINVDTSNFDKDYFNFGNINGTAFMKSCANVVWNLGDYTGKLSAPAGGIVVAPYAEVTTDKGHVNGALICDHFNQNNEVHQVTRGEYDVPDTPDPDEPDPEEPTTEESSEETTEDTGDTGEVTTDEPDQPTTDEPDQPTTDEPDQPTTDEPDQPTTDEPDQPTTDEPDQPTTDEPDQPTTDEPDQPTTDEPDQPTTDEPDQPTTDEPDQPTTDEPDQPTTDEPDQPTTDEPDQPTTDEPDQPTTDEPDQPTTDEPDQPVNPDKPDPDQPVTPDKPDPDQPVTPDKPDPDQPVNPDKPDPDQPVNPDKPDPDQPVTPDKPDPDQPVTPDKPDPNQPVTPDKPDPNQPVTPDKPDPDQPVDPDQPDDPDDPDDPITDEEPPYDPSDDPDDADDDSADPEEIEFLPDDVPLAEVPVDNEPNNPINDEITIGDSIIPMGENPNMGVEGPAGAGIAAIGAAAALAIAAKKRKK